jgi:hypothetical protein
VTPDTFWTAPRIAALRQRWEAGDNSADIGRDLGCSRENVRAKARRLGLQSRRRSVKWQEAPTVDELLGLTEFAQLYRERE